MASTEGCTCTAPRSGTPWSDAHCHIVVTGASRGFGRALCLRLVEALTNVEGQAKSVTILLMGRDLEALQQTKSQITSRRNPQSDTQLTAIVAHPALEMAHATEASMMNALRPLLDFSRDVDGHQKQWNVLVHNAATLGSLKVRADERLAVLEEDVYYRVNLTAPMMLTGLFLRHFAPYGKTHQPVMVINVSSLAAVQPFPYMSDYCVGKAARQMYMRCLATDRPSIAVFNYSPGPLDTDMYTEIAEEHGDEKFKAQASENKRSGRLVAPEESARVCVAWLRRISFIDGLPKANVCPVHQSSWLDLWRGLRLDYFDAIAIEKEENLLAGKS